MAQQKKITVPSWKISFKPMTKEGLKFSFFVNREYALSKDEYSATLNDNYWALAFAIRDRLIERWIQSQQRYHKENVRRVYYLSMEFLIGRQLGNNIYNLGLEQEAESFLKELGFDLSLLREQEPDAGLGNGGLGRLAACFLDSMATLGIPAHGYGIRYDYGIFNQKIEDGYQMERPDEWLRLGSPWEFARPEYTVKVRFYGKVQMDRDAGGRLSCLWTDTQDILAVPYDIPIPGYKNDVVNTLRLWSARSTEEFDLEYFNSGDYEQAVYKKIYSENISKVLYPNDEMSQGRELRLKQEYFFTAASMADIIRRFKSENSDLKALPEKICIQLNDTHPTLAIVELMRILLDDYFFDWGTAWETTLRTFAYTNHTLMPEALETWPVPLLENLLPRHMQIIYEINAKFLSQVKKRFPSDQERLSRLSLIEEGEVKKVRMANLAVVGGFSVNGVSKLHSRLLQTQLFHDFYELSPEKFNNKTNGITPRRWLLKANPRLAALITQAIGDQWVRDLDWLDRLTPLAQDSSFWDRWEKVKLANKEDFVEYLHKSQGLHADPHSLFDVQVKRIHEYKRQLLFALYIIAHYLKIKNNPKGDIPPRTFMIGGKAAPGYWTAKWIIKFINDISATINADKAVKDKMQVIFLENYRISLAERVFPASELSEQISTAGTEASGTGNMKFMINGALTMGTLDGANIEMMEEVGEENIFIFGLRAEAIKALKERGYHPQEFIRKSPLLEEVISHILNGSFSPKDPGRFHPLMSSILNKDPFMICADFDDYCKKQDEASHLYFNRKEWNRKSILNVARSGFFSSDRTVREYARDIWKMEGFMQTSPRLPKPSHSAMKA